MGHEYGVKPLLDDDELSDSEFGRTINPFKSSSTTDAPSRGSSTQSTSSGTLTTLTPSLSPQSQPAGEGFTDVFGKAPFSQKKRGSSAQGYPLPADDPFSKVPFRKPPKPAEKNPRSPGCEMPHAFINKAVFVTSQNMDGNTGGSSSHNASVFDRAPFSKRQSKPIAPPSAENIAYTPGGTSDGRSPTATATAMGGVRSPSRSPDSQLQQAKTHKCSQVRTSLTFPNIALTTKSPSPSEKSTKLAEYPKQSPPESIANLDLFGAGGFAQVSTFSMGKDNEACMSNFAGSTSQINQPFSHGNDTYQMSSPPESNSSSVSNLPKISGDATQNLFSSQQQSLSPPFRGHTEEKLNPSKYQTQSGSVKAAADMEYTSNSSKYTQFGSNTKGSSNSSNTEEGAGFTKYSQFGNTKVTSNSEDLSTASSKYTQFGSAAKNTSKSTTPHKPEKTRSHGRKGKSQLLNDGSDSESPDSDMEAEQTTPRGNKVKEKARSVKSSSANQKREPDENADDIGSLKRKEKELRRKVNKTPKPAGLTQFANLGFCDLDSERDDENTASSSMLNTSMDGALRTRNIEDMYANEAIRGGDRGGFGGEGGGNSNTLPRVGGKRQKAKMAIGKEKEGKLIQNYQANFV